MSTLRKFMDKSLLLPGVLSLFGTGLIILSLTGGLNTNPEPTFVQGEIDGTRIDVAARFSARVGDVLVRDGSPVRAGDILLTMDGPEIRAQMDKAGQTVKEAEATLTKLLTGERQETIQRLRGALGEAVSARKLAETTYTRVRALTAENAVSQQRCDEAKSTLSQCRAKEEQTRAALDMALNGSRAEDIDAARAKLQQSRAAFAEIQATASDLVLASPVTGEVDKVVMKSGEFASAGYPLVTLVNLNDLWVVVLLREDQMVKVKMGKTFKGKIPALGSQEVIFKVDYISPLGNFATWRATNNSGSCDLKTFEIHGHPVSPVEGLRPGMSVVFSPDCAVALEGTGNGRS